MDLCSGWPPKVEMASGAMHVFPTLRVSHSSKWHGFFLGVRRSSGFLLRVSQYGGIRHQASGDGCLKTQARDRIMVQGLGSSDLLDVW